MDGAQSHSFIYFILFTAGESDCSPHQVPLYSQTTKVSHKATQLAAQAAVTEIDQTDVLAEALRMEPEGAEPQGCNAGA